MKKLKIIGVLLLVCLIITGCTLSLQNQPTREERQQDLTPKLIDASSVGTVDELVSAVKPAVMGIFAQSGYMQSIGTGVAVKPNGYVLTNNHVIEDATLIRLYLSNGTTSNATLVWKDSSADIAILKSDVELPYLPMADENSYSSGDEVIAIGTPLALAFKHTTTKGIISALNRTIQVDTDYGTSTLNNLIQHDASINPGNSGGPLIDMGGRVVGINTVKVADAEGLGFAIPIDTISPVIENVNANGYYNTSYLGVFGYDAQLKNIGKIKNGFYVQDVAKNSPAEKIGLIAGDVILSINNNAVDGTLKLKKQLYKNYAGSQIEIRVERESEEILLKPTLAEHPCCYKAQPISYFNFEWKNW